jgi:tellurite resistance protein
LIQVARLKPESHKAQMVFDACVLIAHADRETHPVELEALSDIRTALGFWKCPH